MVPMRAMAVSIEPSGMVGVTMPLNRAPTSGCTTMAVIKNTTAMRKTMPVRTLEMYLMLPERTRARAAAEITRQ